MAGAPWAALQLWLCPRLLAALTDRRQRGGIASFTVSMAAGEAAALLHPLQKLLSAQLASKGVQCRQVTPCHSLACFHQGKYHTFKNAHSQEPPSADPSNCNVVARAMQQSWWQGSGPILAMQLHHINPAATITTAHSTSAQSILLLRTNAGGLPSEQQLLQRVQNPVGWDTASHWCGSFSGCQRRLPQRSVLIRPSMWFQKSHLLYSSSSRPGTSSSCTSKTTGLLGGTRGLQCTCAEHGYYCTTWVPRLLGSAAAISAACMQYHTVGGSLSCAHYGEM